jgi:hypothetical protein
MKFIKILILSMTCLAYVKPAAGQTIVQATIDSTMLLIGEQTRIHLEIITDKNRQVMYPVFSESSELIEGVLVLETGKPDTVAADNGRISIKQHYLITSFDSALYIIPPFPVVDGQDTVYSNPLVLKVITFPDVDPANGITDIKPVMDADFVLSDYYLYIFGIPGALLLLCIIMYIIQKWKRKEPVFTFKAPKPKLPPHVEAINRLDRIKIARLWQQGRNKEYYSDITDVLRKYVLDRFGVLAMEMTSDEILSEIYRLNDAHSVYSTLKQILKLADLVKFAKYVPLPDDSEITLLNAYLFVNQTKIEELKLQEKEKSRGESEETEETVTDEDKIK